MVNVKMKASSWNGQGQGDCRIRQRAIAYGFVDVAGSRRALEFVSSESKDHTVVVVVVVVVVKGSIT